MWLAFSLKDFNPDVHQWEQFNTTEFINKTAHQLEDFIDRYKFESRKLNPSMYELFIQIHLFNLNWDLAYIKYHVK